MIIITIIIIIIIIIIFIFFPSSFQDKADSISLHADSDALAQQFPLTSVVSDREMPFNSTCGQVSVVCYLVSLWCINYHSHKSYHIFENLKKLETSLNSTFSTGCL